jgi:hypothetical protein
VAEALDPAELETIDLKDPAIAGLLAWLIPGLGHFYQGRWAKAILYFVCIMGLFSYGVYLSSSSQECPNRPGTEIGWGRAVYFAWQKDDHHLPYLCQIGVGLPALPALVQAYRASHHQRVWRHGFMAPPWPSEPARERAEDDARRAGANDGAGPNFNTDQPTLDDLNRLLPSDFDIAGFFTMVAGLLNVLAIYDAAAGPVVMQPADKKKDDEEEAAAHV